jgi:hypothetical protein
MKLKLSYIIGLGALALMVTLSLRHAHNNYGILDGNLPLQVLAQTNNSGGGTTGDGGGTTGDGGGTTGNGGGTTGNGNDGGTTGNGDSSFNGGDSSNDKWPADENCFGLKVSVKSTFRYEVTDYLHINTGIDYKYTTLMELVCCEGSGGICCFMDMKMIDTNSEYAACVH